MNTINSTNFIFKSPTLISAFSWFCTEQSWVMVLCAWNRFYDSHLVLAHASRKHQDKTCKEIFFERWKESLPKKTRVLHEEVAQKEDRKELEQIYMSFPKMCSSLDPLVYLEMLGRAAAQQERTALAQPVMVLSCLEMWHLLSLTVTAAALCPLRRKEKKLHKLSESFNSPCKTVWVHLSV